MIKFLRLFLFPFSIVYSLIISIRNKLYDLRIFKTTTFDLPIISVGNLSTGGTGKTPHIEYLVSKLSNNYKLATLSRGYKRKTKGFLLAKDSHTALEIGDEPKQFQTKFPNIDVAVDSNRVNGVEQLLKNRPDLEMILLDDAYQHRKIGRSINILLTEYSNPFFKDYILPMGNLRESRSGYNRANIIIVTKSPTVLSPLDIRRVKAEIQPKPYQEIYFSYISYGKPIPLTEAAKALGKIKLEDFAATVLTAIANPEALKFYIKRYAKEVNSINFPDHHYFSDSDLEKIKQKFDELLPTNKILITTEKDAMRIDIEKTKDFPIFYIPIKIKFHLNDGDELIDQINKYVTANSRRS
ncbi:tetraacyldisaccharide 4'-kinase [bacterium]|nr:tetraacyldisaccharide 4'-kinase [bacterium]